MDEKLKKIDVPYEVKKQITKYGSVQKDKRLINAFNDLLYETLKKNYFSDSSS